MFYLYQTISGHENVDVNGGAVLFLAKYVTRNLLQEIVTRNMLQEIERIDALMSTIMSDYWKDLRKEVLGECSKPSVWFLTVKEKSLLSQIFKCFLF